MTATYDLYAGSFTPFAGHAHRETAQAVESVDPHPPALLWGVTWRLFLLEAATVSLLGDLTPWLPGQVAPLCGLALLVWGLPCRLFARWGACGAVWRVLVAATVITLLSSSRLLLSPLLVAGFVLCLAEPVAQRVRIFLLAKSAKTNDRSYPEEPAWNP